MVEHDAPKKPRRNAKAKLASSTPAPDAQAAEAVVASEARAPGRHRQHEDGHQAPMPFHAAIEHPGELTATTNACGPGKRGGHDRAPIDQASSETVSRLRPLARRRLSTSRPFLVSIRTRKPWVFARRRVLGWNVRFPLAISVISVRNHEF
jgi:hypothetical protein